MTRSHAGLLRVRAFIRGAVVGVLVTLVRAYQVFLSPIHGPSCRFQPTCSTYAIEALQRHGPFWGVILSVRRLARCHPLGGLGYDPVPPVRPSIALIISRLLHGSHHAP